MIIMNPWEVKIENDWQNLSMHIWIYRKITDTEVEIMNLGPDGIPILSRFDQLAEKAKPSIRLSIQTFAEIADPLLEALSENGATLPKEGHTEGNLIATLKHLEDMRRLVFKEPEVRIESTPHKPEIH